MLPKELDLAMTTNGLLLEKFAVELAESGLDRVTVSLDALDVETFQAMGDTKETPETVLRGIEAARLAGLKVKVNAVIRAGTMNILLKKLREIHRHRCHCKYIEFMDVGETNSWDNGEVITAK